MRITERLPGERGRDYALRMLRDNIVTADLAPGSVVSENELAQQLKLSRTPVREAIIELSKANVIQVYPQRGSVVSLIDYKMVDEAQFMRLVLECAVVELLAATAKPEQLEELEANLAMQEFYATGGSADAALRFFDLDNEFHKLLFAACGKESVHDLMRGFELHFDRVRSLNLRTTPEEGIQSERRTLEDHRAILAAVRAHDPVQARVCMETHLTRYRLDEQLLRERFPDYFKK